MGHEKINHLVLQPRPSAQKMHIYRNTEQLPPFNRAVITIGTFDGMHCGHQRILDQLQKEAARIDGETVIITFHPHPRKIVKGATADLRLINTLDEKAELLSWKKIDHLVVVPFTEAFANLTAEQYIREFLLEKFHPHTIIIGYDHQFGKGRQGDYHLLESFSEREGFELQEIPVYLLNEASVSSTRIRQAIAGCDIDTARQLLGYDFFFSGRVMEGNKLGRTIGFPTANLKVEDAEKLIPGDGVYAVEVAVEGSPAWAIDASDRLKGMMNIGMRPTVDGKARTIEVNILDYNGDLYGKNLRVFVRKYLRGEQKFNGLDALKQQLAADREAARAALTP